MKREMRTGLGWRGGCLHELRGEGEQSREDEGERELGGEEGSLGLVLARAGGEGGLEAVEVGVEEHQARAYV